MLIEGLSQFAERHWIIGGILTSLLWFFAGFSNMKKSESVIFWQSIAVIIVLIVCGWTIREGQWLGLLVAILVLSFEVWTMRRLYRVRIRPQ
jgi:hypothetical protein